MGEDRRWALSEGEAPSVPPDVGDGAAARRLAWGALGVGLVLVLLAVLVALDPGLVLEEHEARRILESAKELTLDQEGLVLHPYLPHPTSGVTIGYGYDMGSKSSWEVERHLRMVDPPIRAAWIIRLAAAAGLTGAEAEAFVAANGDIALDGDQARALFDTTYADEAGDARAFATNPADYAGLGVDYPAADWEALHPAIEGILIDLKFRGDYRPWLAEQQPLQQYVVANDPEGVLRQLHDISIFPPDLASVAPARFEARIEWMRVVLGE